MATDVILPALGMSQDTGKIVQWLKAAGEQVAKGEALAEIETDKATVEIEAPAAGILGRVAAANGDDVPVGQVIAAILTTEEAAAGGAAPVHGRASSARAPIEGTTREAERETLSPQLSQNGIPSADKLTHHTAVAVSSLASRIAAEYNLDLGLVKSTGKRIQKADVLAYLQSQEKAPPTNSASQRVAASPKARRLAREQRKNLAAIRGSGPGGAVLAADVLAATEQAVPTRTESAAPMIAPETAAPAASVANEATPSTIWRIMAERTTQSWTSVPHFYLTRTVNASQLIIWREGILKRSTTKITYTDLLVKIIATALRRHPRLNASWREGTITLEQSIHIGLAVAVEDGLVVPVIHHADTLGLSEIAQQRVELVAKARSGKLRLPDLSGGTFTISNLGMHNIDAFSAIINQPQAAILAVGRIAEQVVPVNGQPAVQPMMTLTLSCDHRVVDGARGAQFLATIAELISDPLGILD